MAPFTFDVHPLDHYRIADGFPELRELSAVMSRDMPYVSVSLRPSFHCILVALTVDCIYSGV